MVCFKARILYFTSGLSKSLMISSCCTADAFSVWKSTVHDVSMDETAGRPDGAMMRRRC